MTVHAGGPSTYQLVTKVVRFSSFASGERSAKAIPSVNAKGKFVIDLALFFDFVRHYPEKLHCYPKEMFPNLVGPLEF
jgi:hypothetical protein